MSNDSTSPGWITPIPDDTPYDEELERILSRWISNVSGLPGKTMYPKWQPKDKVRPFPAPDTSWCAFGISDLPSTDYPAFIHQTEDGSELSRHEDINCFISFYGPSGSANSSLFRDGISINQNNDELNTYGLSVTSFTRITPAPEVINSQWVRRYDMTVSLRRKIIRKYAIKNIVSAEVKFFGE